MFLKKHCYLGKRYVLLRCPCYCPYPNNELKGYQVQGIRALVSYEGTNALELVEDFHAAVDDYLDGAWYEP